MDGKRLRDCADWHFVCFVFSIVWSVQESVGRHCLTGDHRCDVDDFAADRLIAGPKLRHRYDNGVGRLEGGVVASAVASFPLKLEAVSGAVRKQILEPLAEFVNAARQGEGPAVGANDVLAHVDVWYDRYGVESVSGSDFMLNSINSCRRGHLLPTVPNKARCCCFVVILAFDGQGLLWTLPGTLC
jgi:hypothetical protein